MLIAIDTSSFERRGQRPMVAEDPARHVSDCQRGPGRHRVGQFRAAPAESRSAIASTLPTPGGLLNLPIAGIITDWSDQQGSVFLDRAVYEQHWQDDTVNVFRVYVTPGTDPLTVRQRILERLSPAIPDCSC